MEAIDLLATLGTRRETQRVNVPWGTSEQDHKRFQFTERLARMAEADGAVGVDVNLTCVRYVDDPDFGLEATYYDHSGLTWADWEAFRPYLDQDSPDCLAEAIIAGALYRRGHEQWRAERGSDAALAAVARAWGYKVNDNWRCHNHIGLAEKILLEAGLRPLVQLADDWLANNPEPPARQTVADVLDEMISIKDAATRKGVKLKTVASFARRHPEIRAGEKLWWGRFSKAWDMPATRRRRDAVMKKRHQAPTPSDAPDGALRRQLLTIKIFPAELEEIADEVKQPPRDVKRCMMTYRDDFSYDEANQLWSPRQ